MIYGDTSVARNNTEMVKLLLELKAVSKLQIGGHPTDMNGQDCIDQRYWFGGVKDPMKKNSGGLTPLDYAQSKQRSAVL